MLFHVHMLLLMQLFLFNKYIYDFFNMHAPLVIFFSEINKLQLGIAGRRRTAMQLPDNITICTILKLYEYV